ncbi:hypothetical protein [Sphingomonas sp.]|jgi:hypothetical protein|uniref:hypothetical protein n=1 Tax=Sphingomonas sp. TaxID=28214 RepID=UPI002E34E123|nr:hypothetical protein [Sphingomonas sp.]HEX4694377.1 hypothetical protein [Sphingomonas sp.]
MRSLSRYVLALLLVVAWSPALAQQRPDPDADVSVPNPIYAKGAGPVIAIDSGHREFNTIKTGYGPLATLLGNDGYVMVDYADAITPANLAGLRVLIIAEPNSPTPPPSKSPIDTLSAFTPAEIQTLHDWVEGGGALMLVADHPPFIGGVRDLAQAFGFTYNRYAAYDAAQTELFTRANGGLIDGPLTQRVVQFRTFFGTAFTAPPGAQPLLKLDSQWTFDTAKGLPHPVVATSADWRGATMLVGKGRLIVFGEAGDLSAQISIKNLPMGFNAPDATGNRQMVRNMVLWLATGSAPAPAIAAPLSAGPAATATDK